MKAPTWVLLVFATCLLIGCNPKGCSPPPTDAQGPGDLGPYRNPIFPEPIPIKGPLEFNASLLPQGARGKFSSYDGDAFMVNIPPRVTGALSTDQVYGEVVKPLVTAMGYGSRAADLRAGGPEGTALPKANLAALATETCKEFEGERYQRFHPVCEALSKGGTNEIAEQVLQAAYGMSVAQFRADIERTRIQYTFLQQVEKVPIEHAVVVAERNDGETITSVYGTLFNRYAITNANKLSPEAAVDAGQSHVLKFKGIDPKSRRPDVRGKPPVLVLLPYGSAPDGSIGLKYAYRALLFANVADKPSIGFLSWMAWIDAEDGKLLQLAPQFDDVSASGMTWRRDPNTSTQVKGFQVDGAASNLYILQRAGVLNRVDRLGDGNFDDDEVSISDSANGSSATFANFNQAPINDATNASCSTGNNTFRQVNIFAHASSFRDTLMGAGSFPTFPEGPTTILLDLPQEGNSGPYDTFGPGLGALNIGTGAGGFTGGACPDISGGVLPGSTDAGLVAHEYMHMGTKRLQERRPDDWCGMAPCSDPSPTVRQSFHDYTDAWAHAYASTPCMGGWYRKNMGGVDASENCVTHNEGGGLPRLASVSEPFNTATVLDHFPERRATLTGGYEDMHIHAAALWLTRQGMRSKCLPSGTPQYWVRINRALYNSGFITSTCASCDRDIYRYSQNFAQQMAQQWTTAGQPGGPPGFAHNGAHTTNKLLSAWARVGIFLIPFECIDGDATTGDMTFCPVASGGENGGDAIGDVFDGDAADDVVIDQITHVEMDWIERGTLPTFRVWTGPRFKFNASGSASGYTPSAATPSPCNTKFRVEMASDDAFTVNVINGPWTDVSTTAQPECYGTWQPEAADWTTLAGATGAVKVYYRIRTRDAADANEKLSTSPGSGSFPSVPASYLVVNDAGQP